MKRTFTLIAILAFFGLVLSSYDNGVAEQQNQDRTGAPGSTAHCGVSCHNAQNYSPTLDIQLIDPLSNTAVSEYIAGQTYEIRYVINVATGTPNGYGFQSTALFSNNQNAGTFQNPGNAVQLEDVNGRHIIEHSQPHTDNTFVSEWVAPETGGSVTFYASSVAVNGNGANSGDGYAGASLSVNEASISVLEDSAAQIEAFAFGKTLTLTSAEALDVEIMSVNGQKVRSLKASEGKEKYDLNELQDGFYFILVPEQGFTKRIYIGR